MIFRKKRRPQGDIGNHKFCPVCGNKLETHDSYCTRCGYSFEGRSKKKKKRINWRNLLILIIVLIVAYLVINYFTTGSILPDFVQTAVNTWNNSSYVKPK